VYEKINERVARYLFFMLLFNAGMWNASSGNSSHSLEHSATQLSPPCPAFLPSSFAMYTCTMAFSYSLEQPCSQSNRRTLLATLLFATGGIVGWPFALALAIPFVFEELFVFGVDRVPQEIRWSWTVHRWKRLFFSGAAAALLFVRRSSDFIYM